MATQVILRGAVAHRSPRRDVEASVSARAAADASDLLRALVSDDPRAFRLLATQYGGVLAGIAGGFGYPVWARAEFVHDVLAKVWEARWTIRDAALTAFVLGVARNLARDRKRRTSYRQWFEDRDALPDQIPAPGGQSAEEALVRQQCIRRVREFLAAEAPEMARVFDAAFVDDLSRDEIAARLGVTPRAARRRVDRLKARALASLGKLFGKGAR